jgi:sugar phosphate isomerase/epimerase
VFKWPGPAHIGLQLPRAEVHDFAARHGLQGVELTTSVLDALAEERDARAFLTVLDEVGFDGPAFVEPFNAEVRALAPEERVAAVAASLESVRP